MKTINIKRLLSTTLILAGAAILLQSCYEDKTSLKSRDIGKMTITNPAGVSDTIAIENLSTINLDPIVDIGNNNAADIEYLWTLSVESGTTVKTWETLAQTKQLSFTLNRQATATLYVLSLKVTNKATTIVSEKIWRVKVLTLGSGITVADTYADGSADINLIKDPVMSYNFDDKPGTVIYKINEGATGEPFYSPITSINYGVIGATYSTYYNALFTMFADGNILYLNPAENFQPFLSFTVNIDIAGTPTPKVVKLPLNKKAVVPNENQQTFMATKVIPSYQQHLMVANNKVYRRGYSDTRSVAFGAACNVPGGNNVDNNIVLPTMNIVNSGSPEFLYFDNVQGAFIEGGTWSEPTKYTEASGFNPTGLTGNRAIAAGVSSSGNRCLFLLKNNNTSNYTLYPILIGGYDVNWNPISSQSETPIPVPVELNTKLNSAVSIFFATYAPVMYIATATEITAVDFSNIGAVTSSVQYTAPAGETITMAEQFIQGRFKVNVLDLKPYGQITELPWNTKAIVVVSQKSTYDGVVTVIPQTAKNSGVLNTANKKTFTGFGKITAITALGE